MHNKPIVDLMVGSLSLDNVYSKLDLDEVLEGVLSTVCDEIGFSFATVSLVDEDEEEITTRRGKNVPEEWIKEAHHSVNSPDIQAYVLRSGHTVYLGGKEAFISGETVPIVEGNFRFDEEFTLDWEIFKRWDHEKLVRVFVPIGKIGTIEAGFYRHQRKKIEPILIKALERYADGVCVAFQNALSHEQLQQHATLLTELHKVSRNLQRESQQGNDALLLQIAKTALEVLQAHVVRVYPLEQSDSGASTGAAKEGPLLFADPISWPPDGDSKEGGETKLPYNAGNIVQKIARTRESQYLADAWHSRLLRGKEGHPLLRSFAGVPLQNQGILLGVLCINYWTRHRFIEYEKQIIELFAQQAAVLLRRNQLVGEQERRKERQRLENELHGSVKSGIRALQLFSEEASAVLETDPDLAKRHLHEIRRTAWGVRSDIDLVLGNLAPEHNGQALSEQVRDEVQRLVHLGLSETRL